MSGSELFVGFPELVSQLEELAAINRKPDGSCCRLALSEADLQGRTLVTGWMKDAGMDIQIDQIGNIIATRPGLDSKAAPIMTGSHIDTVATGGRYDGAYGVLAGLSAVRALNEAGIETKRSICVVVFTNEEGVRFQPDMMGSIVYAGGFSLDDALAAQSEDGVRLGDELKRIGYAGDLPCGAIVPHGYVELHIEQGPVLDRHGEILAAVVDLQGISWREVTVRGTSNHAGTTPMQLRQDAAYCAGRITAFVRDLARAMGGSQVGTVGAVRLVPNLINVIAREAKVSVDLRNTSAELLEESEAALDAFLVSLAQEENVTIQSRQLARTEPVKFDEGVVSHIAAVAAEMGHPNIRRMTSGAGHDAQMIARLCPAAMIFVPSINGISHNPAEATAPEHLEIGANVLLRTLERMANE